jgi:hypothetical protein
MQEQATAGDFLDKEWLTINPANGELYVTYTRFSAGGTTPLELVPSDVATSWSIRADARPTFSDYKSSDLLNDTQFMMIWADGRFPPPAPAPQAAISDVVFTIANGLGMDTG